MKKQLLAGFTVLLLLLALLGPAAAEGGGASAVSPYDGQRMGIITGTNFEAPTLQYFPNSEHLYFNSYVDAVTALFSNKIDGFLGDEPALRTLAKEMPDLAILPEKLVYDDYAFCFGKNSQRADLLRGQFNEMLADLKGDGTLDAMSEKWFGDDEAAKTIDLENGFSGENGPLNVVTTATTIPFSYVKNNRYAGLALELVEMFCRRYGYTPVIADVDYSARIPGLVSGKYDMCASPMSITEERKESINFSEPYFHGGIVMAMRRAGQEEAPAKENPFAAFAGKQIAVQVGTINGEAVSPLVPDIELSYYNSQTDCMTALKAGKADAWATDEPIASFMLRENPDLEVFATPADSSFLAGMFAKSEAGRKLCDQYSAFVDGLRADGTLAEIKEIWFGQDEEKRAVMDYEALPNPNGTLRMAVDTSIQPFAFVKENRIVGYDVDIAARFCQANGYRLDVEPMSAGGIIPALQAGKCDFAACGITITEERAESVLFSSPNYDSGTVLVIRRADKPLLAQASQGSKISVDDLDGKRIGVMTGTISGRLVETRLPNAQVNYYNTQADSLAALRAGKIDAWCSDEPILRFMRIDYPELQILDEYLAESHLAAVFPKTEKGRALCSQYNAFLEKLWSQNVISEIDAVWFGPDEARRTVMDYESLPAANGTLHMAVDLTQPPFTYMKNSRAVGYDIDVAARFCQEYGYGLVIENMTFDGVLASVQSGKCDFASSCITITKEREESMLFSLPNYYGGIAMAVMANGETGALPPSEYTSVEQLLDKRIGVQTGTSFDGTVAALMPNAETKYYNNKADLVAALTGDKIDAFVMDEPVARILILENDQVTYLPEYLDAYTFAMVFPKNEAGDALREQFNAFLGQFASEGKLDALAVKWLDDDENLKTMPDIAALSAENGVLRVATEAAYTPFEYVRDGKVVGLDMELIALFCEAYGYGLEIVDMNFDGVLPAVQTGKVDFAASGITVTEERKESVNFSDPYYKGGTVLVVRKAEAQPAGAIGDAPQQERSFWDGIQESFYKTFIRESRWKLFLEGVGNTMVITLLSILLGTALGFLVFMACRNGSIVANGVSRFSMWLVQGMPMVVLLMILYYIVFGSMAISGVLVAVIGFTLTFGSAVFGMLKMGVGTIDPGQYEAAYALGHSNRHTFYKIILPQAIPHVLPAYQGEIVGLIKATAIVGYIAVQDLTKMGDIVRSRTYEAFFPLIAITVIYFVLEGLFSFLVSRIRISIDPKKRRREKILKGVKLHD